MIFYKKILVFTNSFLFENEKFINKNFIVKAIALFSIINILLVFPDRANIFGSHGFISRDVNNLFILSYSPQLSWLITPLARLGLSENLSLLLIITIYLMSLVCILMDYGRLVFSVLIWFIHLMFVQSSYLFAYGADYFLSFLLFVNIFFNLDTVLKPESFKMVCSFAIRFLQIHLCIVYFFSGFGKTLGISWFDGNAIWYLANTYFPWLVGTLLPLAKYPILFKMLSVSVVLIELLYPFFIWFSKTRRILLILIIILHLSIGIFMQFYTFAAIMILMNLIAFGYYFKKDFNLSSISFGTIWRKLSLNKI